MAFKANEYKVEAINMQNKVSSKETFKSRTSAEVFGNTELRKSKIKLIKINGKIWKIKGK